MSDDESESFCVNGEDSKDIAKKVFRTILDELGLGLDSDSRELSELEQARIGGTIVAIGEILTGYGKHLLDATSYKEAEAPNDSD